MPNIFVRTATGELIDKIQVEDSYLEQIHCQEYTEMLVTLAIKNAFTIESRNAEAAHALYLRSLKMGVRDSSEAARRKENF